MGDYVRQLPHQGSRDMARRPSALMRFHIDLPLLFLLLLLTAYGLLVHGATLGVVGFTMDKVEVRLSNLMAFHARALGNWGCPPRLYPAALDLVLDGKVKVAPFVEQHPLSEINTVFEDVHAGKLTRRAILVPTN